MNKTNELILSIFTFIVVLSILIIVIILILSKLSDGYTIYESYCK